MQTMAQLLAGKGAQSWSVSPDVTVFDALQLMADKDIGALLVMACGRPVGVLTPRRSQSVQMPRTPSPAMMRCTASRISFASSGTIAVRSRE